MAIGTRIKICRERLGLTLEDLSKLVGVSRQTLSRYETGVINTIPSDRVEALAKALRTTPTYLMGWEESYKPVAVSPSDSPPQLTTDEAELIAAFRVADPADQDAVRALLSKYRRKNTKNAVG